MKTNLLLMIILLSVFELAEAQIKFQKTYGGTNNEFADDVHQTTDGGYIMVGETRSFGAGNSDVYLVKTDGNGNMLWAKSFGGTSADKGHSVQQTNDGGYIIAGETNSFGFGTGVYLLKTDGNGNLLWSKKFDSNVYARAVQQTSDNGYIITGGAGSSNRIVLYKTDSIGNLEWRNVPTAIGGNEEGKSVIQREDGGYTVTGFAADDVVLMKTDSSGNLISLKGYGGTSGDGGYSIRHTYDGAYIIAGQALSFGAGNRDIYLLKIDTTGNLLWSRTFGGIGADWAFSIQQTTDRGFILSGYTQSFGAGGADAFLLKTDSSGNYLWSKTFGTSSDDKSFAVEQTTDGGFILGGQRFNTAAANYDFYLIKTDSMGNSFCNETNPPFIQTIPFSHTVLIGKNNSFGGLTVVPATVEGNGGTDTVLCECIPPTNILITSSSTEGCAANTIYVGYGAQSITLTASATGAVSYLWSTGATTQSITVTTAGSYSVTAYDASGCASAPTPETETIISVVDARCGKDKTKITLCHVPEGNPANRQTLCIAPTAVAAHLALHAGDCIGTCASGLRTDNIIEAEKFFVYPHPNPFNSGFNLNLLSASSTSLTVNIRDMLGRIVETHNDVTEQTVIGTKLTAGIYFAEVVQDGSRQMVQIVKGE